MSRPTWVLGLSGSHNGAAALYRDDTLVCAVQEERLTRVKREVLHIGRESRAVSAVLADQGLTAADLAMVVAAPLTHPGAPDNDVALNPLLGGRPNRVITHHFAHALSAYACSGFEDTTALVVDGMGSAFVDLPEAERRAIPQPAASTDREAASIYRVEGGHFTPVEKHVGRTGYPEYAAPTPLGPFSTLGLMYQQVARFTFGSWDAAGKVMGLAPYGRPIISIDEFLELQDNGVIEFRDDLMGAGGSLTGVGRFPAERQTHEDLAASVQVALEEGLLHLVRRARELTDSRRLVCAGGVFLNSVANERILASKLFDEVFIVPFAEDSGAAVGAAFHGVCELLGSRPGRRLLADSLGPLPTDLDNALTLARHHRATVSQAPVETLVPLLEAGAAVGFVSGRSELGPRALGQRSIFYDPRRPDRELLNLRKGRERFRPFAPAVLATHAAEWFELGDVMDSPFMLRVAPVVIEKRGYVPAITHVDGTSRPQTVTGPSPLHTLLVAWHTRTSVPMLLDTSFNRAGEPIVETMCDAVKAAVALELDALWLDDGRAAPHLCVFSRG